MVKEDKLVLVFDTKATPNIVKGTPKYIVKDFAFDFDPNQPSSYSIMIGDIFLSLDWNYYARQAWGYNPISGWISQKLQQPVPFKGQL